MPYLQHAPDFLCVGHCCHDLLPGGRYLLGGTAAYSGIVARQLGQQTGILTSVGPDFAFFDVFERHGIAVCNKAAPQTTVFENIYRDDLRTQYLHGRANTLYPADVPAAWASPAVVQFCPIAGEVDFSLLRAFPDALTGATIQGWLRQWDEQRRVSPKAMDWSQLAGVDVAIFSDADIAGFEAALPRITEAVALVVLTQGAAGATVFHGGQRTHFPAFPVREVDATGAGDVFAAAFLIRYADTRDIARAAAFAHCAASFVVEGVGIQNLASMEQIREREAVYQTI